MVGVRVALAVVSDGGGVGVFILNTNTARILCTSLHCLKDMNPR